MTTDRFLGTPRAATRIPYLYFLAFVLVHEWMHCLPTGWNSEVPSLQAQVAFVQTWPAGGMRQRALWYARVLFSLSMRTVIGSGHSAATVEAREHTSALIVSPEVVPLRPGRAAWP